MSLKLKQLINIPVKCDLSFLLILSGVPFYEFLKTGDLLNVAHTFLFIFVLYFLVVLHEYGHAWAALRCGFPVSSITLWALGGLAKIETLGQASAKEEFYIAFWGPAINFILALLASILLLCFNTGSALFTTYVPYFIAMNLALGIFNLLPIFPLDGGRLLRSTLFHIYKDKRRATRTTAKTGIVLCILLGIPASIFGFIGAVIIFIIVGLICYHMLNKELYDF
jgi:Zn-dependent protease